MGIRQGEKSFQLPMLPIYNIGHETATLSSLPLMQRHKKEPSTTKHSAPSQEKDPPSIQRQPKLEFTGLPSGTEKPMFEEWPVLCRPCQRKRMDSTAVQRKGHGSSSFPRSSGHQGKLYSSPTDTHESGKNDPHVTKEAESLQNRLTHGRR